MVYQENTSSFEDLISKDGSVTVHHSNIQSLAIEILKVAKGLVPVNHASNFTKNQSAFTNNVSANTHAKSIFYNNVNSRTTRYGLETFRTFGIIYQLI